MMIIQFIYIAQVILYIVYRKHFMPKRCFHFPMENIPKKNWKQRLCKILEGKQGYYGLYKIVNVLQDFNV